ncbi:Gldg family protein, partial [bacterium]|nr:Gldg family protein [bacterium]MBU1635214.1 Gldg family protein [bacterium]
MKFYRWLLTLGLVLIATGLIIYSTSHNLDFKSLLMILIGAIVLIIALFRLDLGRILKDRRLLYGGNMLLVIILATAILGLLNYFSARHSWRVDTNTGKTFSLAPQTVKLLKSLTSDIEILVFDKRINAGPAEDLLREYTHISKRLSYRVVDPDEKPGLSNQYKITQYGSLVVIGGNREEQINLATEEALTNAIIKVTRDKTRRVAF